MQVPSAADKEAARIALLELLQGQRWASLATLEGDGTPLASMVAYVMAPQSGLLLHLSRLAAHTRNLLERPTVSLAVSEPDRGVGDPQTLARVTLQGRATVIGRDGPEYAAARAAYLARLPDAEPLFGFGDFPLLRVTVERARYVGGFGRAFSFGGESFGG